jgi:hypothetical protein
MTNIIDPGTMPWNAGPGMVAYASTRGYSFSSSWYMAATDEFPNIVDSINADRPLLVMFWLGSPYAKWHYCVVKGWSISEAGRFLILNNPGGSVDSVNWDVERDVGWLSVHWFWPS